MPDPASPSLFVGREPELNALRNQLRRVLSEKKPEVALIEADFGMGKTTLANHFLDSVQRDLPGLRLGRGVCSMENSGLAPFGQVLTDLAAQGIRAGRFDIEILALIAEVAFAWLGLVIPGPIALALGKTVESVKEVLKARQKASPAERLSTENVYTQYANLLKTLLGDDPVILFLDDLHWADEDSLRLLFHLRRNLPDQGIFYLLTYRPVGIHQDLFSEIRANLKRYGAREICLETGLDIHAYIRARYPRNVFPETFLERIQTVSEGHPLFLNDLLEILEENGFLRTAPDPDGRPVWRIDSARRFEHAIPGTLTEVIRQRISLLEEEKRSFLKCAAVEGEEFAVQVVQAARRQEMEQTIQSLIELEDSYRFIRQSATQQFGGAMLNYYKFAHRFYRDFLYSQLKDIEKQWLHRQVAEALEQLFSSDPGPVAGQLALHFQEALLPQKAAFYGYQAGLYDQSRYAWGAAEKWFAFCLDILSSCPDDCLQLEVLERSGEGFLNRTELNQARERYTAAVELARRCQMPAARVGSLYAGLADICDEQDRYEEGLELVQAGQAYLKEKGEPLSEARRAARLELSVMEGVLHIRLDHYDQGLQILHQVLADSQYLSASRQVDEIQATAYNCIGLAYSYQEQYTQSTPAFEQAYRLAEKAGSLHLALTYLINIADDLVYTGQFTPALTCINTAVQRAQQYGDTDNLAYALSVRGAIELQLDEPQKAADSLLESIDLTERLGDSDPLPHRYVDLAQAYLALDRPEAASESIETARRRLVHLEDNLYFQDTLAQVSSACGDWAEADRLFEAVIARRAAAGMRQMAARSQRNYARSLAHRGDAAGARALLQAALQTFRDLELDYEIERTQSELARLD